MVRILLAYMRPLMVIGVRVALQAVDDLEAV